MRVLFASTSGAGHVQPVLPLAVALRAHGHDVMWATGTDGCRWAEAAGIDTVSAGMTQQERMHEFERRWPDYAALRGEARTEKMFPHLFGGVTAHAAFPDLLEIARGWRPDLIVSEVADFAAPVVAAALDVPQVTHGFGLVVPPERVALAGELASPLWREIGLAPPPFGGVYDHLYIDIYPPSMQPDDLSYIQRIVRRRPLSRVADGSAPSTGITAALDDERPLVYLTFGTLFNANPTFAAAVEALASMVDLTAVITVGPTGDPDAFGSLPAHLVVERYVPQDLLLPKAAAVASHAGSGTLLGALSASVPQLCLPQAADQFRNSSACVAAGAGISLMPDDATATAIASSLDELLSDDRYRVAATRVAGEIASMPSVEEVAEVVEALV